MKAFRIVVDKRGNNHIQEKQNTLFGLQWTTVFTFNSACDKEHIHMEDLDTQVLHQHKRFMVRGNKLQHTCTRMLPGGT